MPIIEVFPGIKFDFAPSEDVAKERARVYFGEDPFRGIIYPALLNKNDICRYVSKTGLVHPFDPESLKSASYEMCLGNEYFYWDEQSKPNHVQGLGCHDDIVLKKNSITYVTLSASFYLPLYIGLRFNLSITHVHRGLLLGTGPLVDPGFWGKLVIPIHNLTNNEYIVRPGEPLIAVEFTKLSEDENLTERSDWYRKEIKYNIFNFKEYFDRALPRGTRSVQSSIGYIVSESRRIQEATERKLEGSAIKFDEAIAELKRHDKYALWAIVIAVVLSVGATVGLGFQTMSAISDSIEYTRNVSSALQESLEAESNPMLNSIAKMNADANARNKDQLLAICAILRKEIDKLEKRVEKIEAQ